MRLVTRPRYWLNMAESLIVKMARWMLTAFVHPVLQVAIQWTDLLAVNVGQGSIRAPQAPPNANYAKLDGIQINKARLAANHVP